MSTNKQLAQQAYAQLQAGNTSMALQMCEIILAQDASHGNALHIAGLAHKQMGDYPKAIALMRQSVATTRPDPVHIFHLATTLMETGRAKDALAWYERFAEIRPDSDAFNNLGVVLMQLERYADAIKPFKRAVKLDRNKPVFWINYSVALQNSGDLPGAEAALRKALHLKPELPDAQLNLANVLSKLERPKEALKLYYGLIERGLNLDMALLNCANQEQSLGHYHLAEPLFRRAVEMSPHMMPAWDSWLFCLLHSSKATPEDVAQAHRKFAAYFETPLAPKRLPHANDRDPERRLKVGIVSADLRNHVIANFVEPLLEQFSQSAGLEVHAYANSATRDFVSERLSTKFASWSVVVGLSPEGLANKIREDGIDILVDLSGHTAGNCLLTFAHKPAPVQVSWLGYPGTTGLQSMDYYFGDKYFLPEGLMDDQFSEKIVRLPSTIVFKPFVDAPPVQALPALRNGYVTFGSFSHLRKISRDVVALWAELMRAVPDSRLLVGGMPKNESDTDVREWFLEEGIDASRLRFHQVCPLDEYLALHHEVDIHLDPFPYNGGTTTWHAVRMGVPSLSLTGATSAGRSGASILGLVGRSDFVAASKEEYVAMGKDWAARLDDLAAVRAGMREQFAQSLPSQEVPTAKGFEMAWRHMWRRWCQGLPAESFEITEEQVR